MFYQVCLAKTKLYFWDEESSGTVTISVSDDELARRIVSTVVQRMNRKYWRIGEPRNVYIEEICRLEEAGGITPVMVPVCTEFSQPLEQFREIRRALDGFYPKVGGMRGRDSIMRSFSMYRPATRYS